MSNWVETEMGACQLHDARHAKRLAHLLGRLSEKPVHSIPSACHGWAETVAAYRFLDNPAVGEQEILSGHQHATLERIRTQDVVLLVQDTTFLDYGTTQPKKGMGTVKVKVREEYLLHPTVAFTPERMNLGGLGLKMWQRPEQPVAQERHRKPLEEKESYRWLEGYQLACEVQQSCPDTLVVTVADREGDIHEWFLDALQRLPGERSEFIIRAKCNRRIAKGQEPRYLWEEMQKARAAGRITIELTRQPDRPPRQVTLRIAVKRVTFNGVRRPGGRLPPVEVVAVYAKECRPPSSEEPVEWLLLTSLPVADFPSACTVVQWYRCRWEIEVCQTQPVNMTWWPLRNVSRTMTSLRGQCKRERIVDIHLLPGDADFPDQALRDGLAFFKGEPVQIVA
jgi:Transposase DNA-binding